MPILDFLLNFFKLPAYKITIGVLAILLATSVSINIDFIKDDGVVEKTQKKEIDSLRTAIVNITINNAEDKVVVQKAHYEELRKIAEENDKKIEQERNKKSKK